MPDLNPVHSPAGQMTPVQKLAALLIMLGAESAAQVLKNLNLEEVEALSAEMARMNTVDREVQKHLLREFGEVLVESTTAVRGGAEFAQAVLEKGIGESKASAVLNRVAPARNPPNAVQELLALEAPQIVQVLKQERSQTMALVLSCLPPRKASQVLKLLPVEARQEAVERLALLGPTPTHTLETVVRVLLQKAGKSQGQLLARTGGLGSAATLLNTLGRNVTQPLLAALDERNPELGQAIRQRMFTFEDLARLESAPLQRILREVDLRELGIALKPLSENLRTTVLGCISKRAAETVREEMSYLGAVKLRDIESAQQNIVAIARRLEVEGEIALRETAEAEAV